MGSVYEVEHVDLKVHYALKTFTFDPTDSSAEMLRKKFIDEGNVLARLKHPHIAHVFDLAFDERYQVLYFVMDLVLYRDGEPHTVEDVDWEAMDEQIFIRWFKDIAGALDYIHSEGIVHRDIKPVNLLLCPDKHVILSDFGISKVFGRDMSSAINPAMTMMISGERAVFGTDHYIAPELEEGEPPTTAADAYSFGVMMFRILTGKWWEECEDPESLLDGRIYDWYDVISRLANRDPRQRPREYLPLTELFTGTRRAELELERRRRQRRKTVAYMMQGLSIALLLAFIGVGVWLLVKGAEEPKEQPVVPVAIPVVEDEAATAEGIIFQEVSESEIDEKLPSEIQAEREAAARAAAENRARRPAARPVPKKPEPPKAAPKPSAPRPAAAAASVDAAVPARTYAWLGAAGDDPRPVTFYLANGSAVAMAPVAASTFVLDNGSGYNGPARRRVTLAHPFWISRAEVIADQWRDSSTAESDPDGRFSLADIHAFCAALTRRYGAQLPEGYVFRLPTEAEWRAALADRALGFEAMQQPLLDTVGRGVGIVYAVDAVDPVYRAEDPAAADGLCYDASASVARVTRRDRLSFHLAVGFDLSSRPSAAAAAESAAVPEVRYSWDPKNVLGRTTKEIPFQLANGETIPFCTVPRTRFAMSNLRGQSPETHRVELSYPFWISRHCITAKAWREFGPYDCEGGVRQIEEAFPDHPVSMKFARRKWVAFCNYLTRRYGSQLPAGYVFRLPTEAEYEWAMLGDARLDVNSMKLQLYHPESPQNRAEFERLVAGNVVAKALNLPSSGSMDAVMVGGYLPANPLGLRDFLLPGQWTLDTYDADVQGSESVAAAANIRYAAKETNPVVWSGALANSGLVRVWNDTRMLANFSVCAYAHIVVAPDVTSVPDAAIAGSAPETDFGGRFLGEFARVSELSSREDETRWCTEERFASLFTRDNVVAVPRPANRGFLTKVDRAPFVTVEMDRSIVLTGLVIDVPLAKDREAAAPLRVWISEDGLKWTPAAREDRRLKRYRIDLQAKPVHARFIRIGREEGVSELPFALHKIAIYGRR